jgi:hypothetical protein
MKIAHQRERLRRYVVYDVALNAQVRFAPTSGAVRGIEIVEVIGHGYLVIEEWACRKRFPRLYDPEPRLSYLETSYVYAPYIPEGL